MPNRLNAIKVFETREIGAMRAILYDVYDARHFDVPGEKSQFSARAALVGFGSSSLSHCSYGAPVKIDFRDDNYVRFQLCLSGSARTSAAGKTAEFSEGQIVCSPAHAAVELGPSLEQFALRVNTIELEKDLATILGIRPKEAISFGLTPSNDGSRTRRFRDVIAHTAHCFETAEEPIPSPVSREMDQNIRIAALYSMPNNFTDLLYREEKSVAPWQVKRVEEWIDANWQAAVTIEKLAEVSSSSVRSIFATFKKHRGYTPMDYLKRVRLHAARGMLMVAHPGTTVTAIGFACQFSNMGHFARDYQRQFGELPSETLRRSRALAA